MFLTINTLKRKASSGVCIFFVTMMLSTTFSELKNHLTSFTHLINGQGNYADCEIILLGPGDNEYFIHHEGSIIHTKDKWLMLIKIADYYLANEQSGWSKNSYLKEPLCKECYSIEGYGLVDGKFEHFDIDFILPSTLVEVILRPRISDEMKKLMADRQTKHGVDNFIHTYGYYDHYRRSIYKMAEEDRLVITNHGRA